MEIVRLNLADLELNSGQIDGLPVNPREWTQSDIDSLARSLTETPELFEARPIIVVPHAGKYVILGGNLRYEASRKNKAAKVPCVVIPEATPVDKLKEIVIKDNGSWGKWSMDALANEWDDLPLGGWGVPAWDADVKEEMAQTQEEQKPGDVGGEENLPEELQGLDLSPDDLAKIQGDDETAMERVIICYKRDDAAALGELLGLGGAPEKVVYNFTAEGLQ